MTATYIKWNDAAGTPSNMWQTLDELPTQLMPIESAGMIVEEDDEKVTIVTCLSPFGFMGDITIPKSGIVYRKDFNAEG